MRGKILYIAVLALVCAPDVYAFKDHGGWLEYEHIFFVEPGDTYIGLFGADWEKVFQANQNMAFYDKAGKLIQSPDWLVVGTRLMAPKGAYLTQRAMERLNRYEKIKIEALQALEEAKTFVRPELKDRTAVYEQALNLLDEARQAAQGTAYGFKNFIESKRLAEKAIDCFKIDRQIDKANLEVKSLEVQVKEKQVEALNQINRLNKKQQVYLSVMAILLFGLLFGIQRQDRKDRIIKTNTWLARHQDHVRKFEMDTV
ncbi:MAG: hypothetical protein Q8P24_15325 [Desulfobacterales bacterium]|nr:hypothetical protein [Desulfobacterales bacterium]